MGRWNIQTIIAGVDFSLCRAVIVDGANFATLYAGSVARSAFGIPHVQRVRRDVKGLPVGVHMERAEAETINTMRAAVQVKEAAAQAFRLQLQDALYTLDVWAVPDYSQQTWITHGEESEGIIENVTMRFIVVDNYA